MCLFVDSHVRGCPVLFLRAAAAVTPLAALVRHLFSALPCVFAADVKLAVVRPFPVGVAPSHPPPRAVICGFVLLSAGSPGRVACLVQPHTIVCDPLPTLRCLLPHSCALGCTRPCFLAPRTPPDRTMGPCPHCARPCCSTAWASCPTHPPSLAAAAAAAGVVAAVAPSLLPAPLAGRSSPRAPLSPWASPW